MGGVLGNSAEVCWIIPMALLAERKDDSSSTRCLQGPVGTYQKNGLCKVARKLRIPQPLFPDLPVD